MPDSYKTNSTFGLQLHGSNSVFELISHDPLGSHSKLFWRIPASDTGSPLPVSVNCWELCQVKLRVQPHCLKVLFI